MQIYESARSGRGVSLGIESRCHVPLTLEVTFHSLQNLEPDRERPIRVFLEPGARSAPFVRLDVVRPGEGWRYGTRIDLIPGRSPAVHDDTARYAFPFGGALPRQCIQGEHGKLSHWGVIAYDFALPIGTPVVAARPGVVFYTADGFDNAGTTEAAAYLERANVVIVLHADSTIATYAHLNRGLVVTEGDVVAVGTLLGYSGNSGYSAGPHLHFEVAIPELAGTQTVPIRFVGDVVPTPGTSYPATPTVEPDRPAETRAIPE